MTAIDLRGLDGHGVFRLPQYIQRIRAGGFPISRTARCPSRIPSNEASDTGAHGGTNRSNAPGRPKRPTGPAVHRSTRSRALSAR